MESRRTWPRRRKDTTPGPAVERGVRTKRAYVPAEPSDGHRYLVDRLWPRGRTTAELALTGWLRDLAPSTELRRWYQHDPARFSEFRRRYRVELGHHESALARLAAEAREGPVTLVFAAKDPVRCNAGVLREMVEERVTAARARGRPSKRRAPTSG